MKKILSMILLMALLTAGCAFAESSSFSESVPFDATMADGQDYQVDVWADDPETGSKNGAALTVRIMTDLIHAGVNEEEFDFTYALTEGNTFVANTIADKLIVVFCAEGRDLFAVYSLGSGDSFYFFLESDGEEQNPWGAMSLGLEEIMIRLDVFEEHESGMILLNDANSVMREVKKLVEE